MIYKKLLIFLTIGTLSLGLTGCSSKKTDTTDTAAKSGTLYWWRSQEDANIETLTAITKNFEAETGTKVQIVLKDPRTYEEDVTKALLSNQNAVEAPDIVSYKSENMPAHVLELRPVPEKLFDVKISKGDTKKQTGKTSLQYAKQLYLDAAFKAITFNNPATGKPDLYGLPMAVDTLVLYRNKDALKKAADNISSKNAIEKSLTSDELKRRVNLINTAPTTWKELTDAIPFIKITDGNQISQAAIALGTANNVERSYDILQSVMMQNGTKLTTEDLDAAVFNQSQTGVAATGSLGEKALSFYLQFSNPASGLYTWNDKMPNSVEAFKNGQTAMIIHYGSLYRYLINEVPSLKNSIDIAALPQVSDPKNPTGTDSLKTTSNMWVETVPAARKDSDTTKDENRKKAAWSFVYYVSSKSGSSEYLKATQLSSALVDGKDSNRFKAFTDQKKIADVWYKGEKALDVDKTFIKMIDDAYTNRKSKQDALDSAATEITGILQSSKLKWSTAAARKAITTEGLDGITQE